MFRYGLMGLIAVLLATGLPGYVSAQDTTPGPEASGQVTATGVAAAVSAEQGSIGEAVAFYLIGGLVAFCAIGCVLAVNIVRMALCLFGTLGAVAILYFLMGANFLGAVQLIVYAGGTLVVIVFGIMLTSKSRWVRYDATSLEIIAGAVVCSALFGVLANVLARTGWGEAQAHAPHYEISRIGEALLTTYLVPFELASVLLLAVMIGAAFLSRPEK